MILTNKLTHYRACRSQDPLTHTELCRRHSDTDPDAAGWPLADGGLLGSCTLLAGIMGMNSLPNALASSAAFWITTAVMVGVVASVLAFARRREWL